MIAACAALGLLIAVLVNSGSQAAYPGSSGPAARLSPTRVRPLAVPSPTASTAVVTINAGGDRATATTIAPLAGVTFGLFATKPTTFDQASGVTSAAGAVATCTSDADGVCAFVVTIGAGGVTRGTRLWAAPTAVPSGWYANPVWQTGPLTPTATDPLQETRHVFQTPALEPGATYLAGRDWITDPGIATNPAGTPSATYRRRMASGGIWPFSRVDPALAQQCGLNVAIVADLSSSVSGYVPQLKSAIDAFVDSLRGTPSRAALFTFGTSSPATGYGADSGLMPVASTADANRFKALYSGWGNPPTNYTNWDAALNAVAAVNENPNPDDHFDLVVFITDGNPTVYGPVTGGAIPANSGYTRFREIGNAVASASRLKNEGSRIVAVGVGSGVSGAGAAENLRSISGGDAYDGTNIEDADYLQADSYAQAGRELRNLVISRCAPSISVIKQVIPYGGTLADAYTPSEPWHFTAATNRADVTVSPAEANSDPYTGGVNFDVTLVGATSGVVDIGETAKDGYSLHQVDGSNAVCVNKTEDDAPVTVTDTSPTSFSVAVGTQDAISCTVYNQAPDLTVPTASVLVNKQWQVTTSSGTTTYAEGTQPADLAASLTLDGPAGADASGQPWSVPRDDYSQGDSVAVAEKPAIGLPGCTLTGATIRGTGITGNADFSTFSGTEKLQGGTNEWTITNKVACVSHLVLTKEVRGGDADPASWNLEAIGPADDLPGPSGTTGVSAEVTPGATYQLAEQAGPGDPTLLDYAQVDHRTRPLQYPKSTGSMACAVVTPDDGGTAPGTLAAYTDGVEGAISVPLGQTVECTATNTTSQLTIVKVVDGGTAEPGDFTFHLTPVDGPAGLPTLTVPGTPAPGASVQVRPGQAYRLTETGGPGHYELASLTCTSSGRAARHRTTRGGVEITVAAGTDATCTATNAYSLWTVSKAADPPSGTDVHGGEVITYTVKATHLAGRPATGVAIVDDLSRVLDHATFVAGSIDASAGSATLDGTQLTWHIPELARTETLTYRVRVDENAHGVALVNTIEPEPQPSPSSSPSPSESPTEGPSDEVTDGPVPCDEASAQAALDISNQKCDETVNVVPDAGSGGGGGLPNTGSPMDSGWLYGGLGAVTGGSLLALVAGRRSRRASRQRAADSR